MKHFNRISEKLKEADFFLEQMSASHRKVDEVNYYFSAFTSAARSVTFVLQYLGKPIEGFAAWYSEVQGRQRGDKVAKYLLEARNEALKEGAQPIAYGEIMTLPSGEERLINFFSYVGSEAPAEVPDMDVHSTCTHQMMNLVEIVSEFFIRFENVGWDPDEERRTILTQLEEVRASTQRDEAATQSWQQIASFIASAGFQPLRPSIAIQPLVAKYVRMREFRGAA